MSWDDVLGMCVVVLSAALLARESHKMGWAEGHGDGWRGAMEQNTNINGGLRAELAAAHEATDGVREQLKDTEQRLATVGEEWNRALGERDRERDRAWGEIKRARDELARTKALHQLELSDVKQAQASADAFAVVMSGELAKDSLKLADDVEKVLFTRGRGITHEWRRKKLLALCADVRNRWSKT